MMEEGTKTKHIPIFQEVCDNSTIFHTNPSQNFTTYNSQSLFSGIYLTLPKQIRNNTIFLFQKV